MSAGTAVRPETDSAGWLRLDVRVVWMDTIAFLLSMLPSYLTVFLLDLQPGSAAVWGSAVSSALGAVRPLGDLLRWLKTRYRVTDERVEQRVGVLVRKYRYVPRDRIRSVDATARFWHRLAGLRVVHIGSGDAQAPFRLNAVSKATAERLRQELLRGRTPPTAPPAEQTAAAAAAEHDEAAGETELATLRWSWMAYNLVSIWAFFVAGFLIAGVYWSLFLVGIDLRRTVGSLVDRVGIGPGWTITLGTVAVFLIGLIGLAVGFVTENYGFRLVRTPTEQGTALVTRHGLFQTREVHRDDARLRGIHLSEPLFWRWIGLAETEVISTGLGSWSLSSEPASRILPRGPVTEARRVARLVLDDDVHPLEVPLRPHPRAALYRRLWWALCVPLAAAGLLAWLGATGAVAAWAWLVPVTGLPVTVVLAVVAHRALGHTVVGRYVVLRCGLLSRSTAALQTKAVIGWTVRQSFVQRWLGLMTVRVSTAAGYRTYQAPDIGAEDAVAFLRQASPELLSSFVEERESPHPLSYTDGLSE
ncbi:PH domain-containing protein [Streptomyces sp. AK010]|uniref:PH domain-containing protein n=1 Tax=Streptomyces sp. AK010 TaxID=2723074 RepID=UPI001608C14A|nr:PH domain-containing protein [Streptomyces sp. AK010]MBB6421394.1 putative membrane protein [Streptomyces sp. AK010]